MRMVDLIMKTRHGEPLSKNEIEAIVSSLPAKYRIIKCPHG